MICNRNQLYSFKIGASQAKPKYTKDFPENTKENSKSQYFENFYDLIIQKFIKQHLAAILRSWRFFWYPYWHIHEWNMSNSIHVKLCQICHFWHLWQSWHTWHRTYVDDEYVNMGVKRSVRTSGSQQNTIHYIFEWIIQRNFQNTDFQIFSLYF